MATLSPDDIKIQEYTRKLLKQLPDYVVDYYYEKDKNETSFRTLHQYLSRYKHFFNWLLENLETTYPSIKNIPLKELEDLEKATVEMYLNEFKREEIKTSNQSYVRVREVRSIALMISTLKSLFHYLAVTSETSDRRTYIERNVMSKIHIPTKKQTAGSRAAEISTKIIQGDQMLEFTEWVRMPQGYEATLPLRALVTFKRDKERDVLILVLLLSSGIRVGELARIEIKDIDFAEQTIKIVRKGGKADVIYIMDYAFDLLLKYMKVRNERYPNAINCPFLFVSYRKPSRPLTIRAIQYITEKLTGAYFQTGVHPHKLRHSFAVAYIKNGGDMTLLRDILGHSDIQTTSLYVNMANSDRVDSLKVMNKNLWGSQMN